MTDRQESYQSPFSQRYAGKQMQALFSPMHRARLFRRLWLTLAQAQQQLGLPISDEQIRELSARVQDVDLQRVNELEQSLRHDVMAHLKAYAEDCPLAAPILHLGATSCYVTDNADILILRDAMRLVQARLVGTARALAAAAEQYKGLPMLGYTHFQPAQPTTLGKRLALWLQDVLIDLEELDHFLSRLRPLGSKGATGTQASFLALFDGDADKAVQLDRMIADSLGFERPLALSGQTYTRKIDALAQNVLSGIAQSAAKFSGDLRLLQHLKEVEEPFEAAQVGSSAMPYKRNPMRAERMTGLARFILSNAANAGHTAASQWLERSLDDSSNRRLSLAEGFLATDGLLTLYQNIVSGLVVYPGMMERNLRQELPFLATENILMRAVKQGGDRQELHERLRVHAMAAGRRVKEEGLPNDLLERVAGDAAFRLDLDTLDRLMDPRDYTGLAQRQVEDYLAGEAARALEALAHLDSPQARVNL